MTAAVARALALRVPEHVLTVGVFRAQPVAEVRRGQDGERPSDGGL